MNLFVGKEENTQNKDGKYILYGYLLPANWRQVKRIRPYMANEFLCFLNDKWESARHIDITP